CSALAEARARASANSCSQASIPSSYAICPMAMGGSCPTRPRTTGGPPEEASMEMFPAIANVVDVAVAHGGSVRQYPAGMLPQAAEAMPAATEAGEVLTSQLAQGGRTIGQIMGGLAPEAAAAAPEIAEAAPGLLATAGEAAGAIGNIANPIAD